MKNKFNFPWGGGIKELNPSKKAFTLAEVLITLAIIGIVAALTIPTLVSKNEKKQFYTGFMKSYNTLSNAINLSIVENGHTSTWDYKSSVKDTTDKYLAPFLKIVKSCNEDNLSECSSSYSSFQKISGGDPVDLTDSANSVYILADGSAFLFTEASLGDVYGENEDKDDEFYVSIVLDVNSAKGPNVLGRDIYALALLPSKGLTTFKELDDCKPSDTSVYGISCAAKLLEEGAINY